MGTTFRELVVWQKSITLVEKIYLLTKKLPQDERFGLVSQMRRAVVSIPSNIAEGSKRSTTKNYVHFLRVALGSSAELETQLYISEKLYTIDIVDSGKLISEIQKMLSTMIKKLTPTP